MTYSDMETRCRICLGNDKESYNYVELGIEHIVVKFRVCDDRFGKSNLVCTDCVDYMMKEIENQKRCAIRRILSYKIATYIMFVENSEE